MHNLKSIQKENKFKPRDILQNKRPKPLKKVKDFPNLRRLETGQLNAARNLRLDPKVEKKNFFPLKNIIGTDGKI